MSIVQIVESHLHRKRPVGVACRKGICDRPASVSALMINSWFVCVIYCSKLMAWKLRWITNVSTYWNTPSSRTEIMPSPKSRKSPKEADIVPTGMAKPIFTWAELSMFFKSTSASQLDRSNALWLIIIWLRTLHKKWYNWLYNLNCLFQFAKIKNNLELQKYFCKKFHINLFCCRGGGVLAPSSKS